MCKKFFILCYIYIIFMGLLLSVYLHYFHNSAYETLSKTTARFDNLINIIWSENKIVLYMFREIFTEWIGREESLNS